MTPRRLHAAAVPAVPSLALALLLAAGCAPADTGAGPSGTGGAVGSGGAASGGAVGSGGAGTGGAATGGAASGGAPASGGNGSGGAATGGAATGGAAAGGSGAGTGGAGPGNGGTNGSSGGAAGGNTSQGGKSGAGIPDTGTEGDGDSTVGPNYTTQSDLTSKGNPKGRSFSFSVTSKIFDGKDSTLTKTPVNVTRTIQGYVPAQYKDGTPAPVLIIQDGGSISQVGNALDNLTISTDPMRKLPPFVVLSVPNGGSDSIGSERGLEYDTMSDRYARYITEEIMPAAQAALKANYPNFKFDPTGSGRATLGCSSGGSAAFTMAWFRPDLFSRVIAYSATLVAQQDSKAPEAKMYPHGAWDYHSDVEIIKNDTTGREKMLRIFHNANEMDLGAGDAASGRHNWLMAGTRTAAALKAKGFHYKYVEGKGVGHCAGQVQSSTLADALTWVWRGYQPPAQ